MSVEVIDKIKPKNNGGFALVDAADVEMPDGTRLDEVLENVSGSGMVVQTEPPTDTRLLWIDPNDHGTDNTTHLAEALGQIDSLLGGDE